MTGNAGARGLRAGRRRLRDSMRTRAPMTNARSKTESGSACPACLKSVAAGYTTSSTVIPRAASIVSIVGTSAGSRGASDCTCVPSGSSTRRARRNVCPGAAPASSARGVARACGAPICAAASRATARPTATTTRAVRRRKRRGRGVGCGIGRRDKAARHPAGVAWCERVSPQHSRGLPRRTIRPVDAGASASTRNDRQRGGNEARPWSAVVNRQ